MNVLLVSKFVHHVGGVETHVSWLARALAADGHGVGILAMQPPAGQARMDVGDAQLFETPTRDFVGGSAVGRARSAATSIYSRAAGARMRDAIATFRPDVVHFHGTCYQLTSSVYDAARRAGVRRIATQHEYKLSCANQRMWDDRAGAVCQACLGRSGLSRRWQPVSRRCIKGSLGGSIAGSAEDAVSRPRLQADGALTLHAPSRFMESVLVEDGWSRDRIVHLDLPWESDLAPGSGRGSEIVYIGRLAPEKDVATLLLGWARAAPDLPHRSLVIAGDGTARPNLDALIADQAIPRVRMAGRLDRAGIARQLHAAHATVHPSGWFENSPIAVRESLLTGVPAIVADRGGLPELIAAPSEGTLVEHSVDGWHRGLLEHERKGTGPSTELADRVRQTRTSGRAFLDALYELYDRGSH